MPGITISGQAGVFARPAVPAVVQVKPTWGAAWQTVPDLRLDQATACSAGTGTDSAAISRPFGLLKHPWESQAAVRRPVQIAHWWLRVLLCGDAGPQPAWIGRIRDEGRTVHAAGAVPTGKQTWQAYGPVQLLERMPVSRSYWAGDEESPTVAAMWVPGANLGGARGAVYGNRSAEKKPALREGATAYVFDKQVTLISEPYFPANAWSRYDLLEYLVAFFANADTAGPVWRITGQVGPLRQIKDAFELGERSSVADLVRKLIPTQYGLDWTVDPTDDGFAIRVFSLCARPWTWGGVTIPANPLPVNIDTGKTLDNLTTRLAASGCHQYERVRILGKRIVVCCTLWGPAWSEVTDQAGSLAADWSSDLESDYRDAGGKTKPEEVDKYRDQTKFANLYAQFCAPDDWDLHAGAAAPYLAQGTWIPGKVADYQTAVRETLSWLPLWDGFDYATDPPEDHTAGVETDLLKPMLFVSLSPEMERHKRAEDLGLSVSVLPTNWGVRAQGSPRHMAAFRHFDAAAPAGEQCNSTAFDWRWYAATIAFEADQRITLEYAEPGSLAGDTMEIEVEAEAWYLAPNTILGLDEDGQFVNSGLAGRMLRNDREKMGLALIGAVARYVQPRARAEIIVKRLLPWGGLVGGVLEHVGDGGDLQALRSPITQITWQAQEQTTTILAGFAQ